MPAAPAATRKSLSLLNVFIICLPLLSLLVETTSVSAQQAEADVLVAQAVLAYDAVKTSDPDIRQLSLFYKGLSLGVLGLPKQALAELESAQRVQAVSPVTGTAVRIQGRSQQVPDQERQSACGPKSLWEGFTMT